MIPIKDLPIEMLSLNHLPNDVSILIGENGSGKSTLLNLLSKHYSRNGHEVVAIANSIHDKFDIGHEKIKSLRGRSGRKQTRSTIKNALGNIKENDIQKLKYVSQALQYVGFSPMIGFKIINLKSSYENIIIESNLTESDKNELLHLLYRTVSKSKDENIIWLSVESYNYYEIERSSLTRLFKWESTLKKLNIISRIEIFLSKNNQILPMLNASSGELSLITSIIYLSTVITDNTVILIDEPENSLHPKWQKEYGKIILDIFYFFQPKVIIATHSPLIVNGAEIFIEDTKIYKAENFSFKLQHKESLNLEELMFRFFDINTPENRFLSERVVRLLNVLASKKMSFLELRDEIQKIETNSYDPRQIKVLESVLLLASEIENQ